MAWIFGDGFDCYATMADPIAGYWDSGLGVSINWTLIAGRFTGSQACQAQTGSATLLTKSSAANDAVHHIIVAFRQTAALSGTTLGLYFQLIDNVTNQCCIVFRSDGAILLTSATPAGTVLATYTGAVSAQNTWFAFEFEVVINNTTGSFTVRKNGNPSNDFTATSLNTRPGANSYANKLTVGMNTQVIAHQIDDLLWRSDAASVAWAGDIRCYTRMPASDASVQFARSLPIAAVTPFTAGGTTAVNNISPRYSSFTASYDGTLGTVSVTVAAGYTGNMKCTLFASSGSAPTTIIASATTISNPATGPNTFTFPTPPTLTKGTQYFLGWASDTSSGTWSVTSFATLGLVQSGSLAYASFPSVSPPTGNAAAEIFTANITTTSNCSFVNETLQDGTTSYVYDSTIGHADFYNIAPLAVTPAAVIAVVTRGFMEKSDAGFRSGAVQLKSGGSTVAATTLNLATSFLWSWRVDLTDPNTSAAWTPVAVNSVQIGPTVIG
jgi:hypothetical protein